MAQKEKLEEAKRLYQTANADQRYVLESLFPELKESEDERIRKEIYQFVYEQRPEKEWIAWLEKQGKKNSVTTKEEEKAREQVVYAINKLNVPESEKNKLLAWLEKQGGKKPAIEMVTPEESLGIDSETYNDIVNTCIFGENKPKFKVGDWIVNRLGNIWHIDSFDTKNYQVTTNKGEHNYFPINIQDRMHIWTIADAKDGDILCTPNGNTFIFKTIDGDKILDYCGLYFNKFFSDFGSPNGSSTHYDKCNYHPATKEQRDILFKGMEEAGYEWDTEKKELKKIDARENLTLDGDLMEADCMIAEQKPVWTEEDKRILDALISSLINERFAGRLEFLKGIKVSLVIDWLKSLKEKIKGE